MGFNPWRVRDVKTPNIKEGEFLLSRRFLLVVVVVSLGLGLVPMLNAQDKTDAPTLFAKNCKMCHKADGKGIPAMKTPDFTNKEWQASRSDSDLIQSVSKGKDKMPSFENKLKAEEIKLIISDVVRKFAQ